VAVTQEQCGAALSDLSHDGFINLTEGARRSANCFSYLAAPRWHFWGKSEDWVEDTTSISTAHCISRVFSLRKRQRLPQSILKSCMRSIWKNIQILP